MEKCNLEFLISNWCQMHPPHQPELLPSLSQILALPPNFNHLPMPTNGNQWQLIANQWQPMATSCQPMATNGNQWQQWQLIANQWQPMATYCLPMAINLHLMATNCQPMARNEKQWPTRVTNGQWRDTNFQKKESDPFKKNQNFGRKNHKREGGWRISSKPYFSPQNKDICTLLSRGGKIMTQKPGIGRGGHHLKKISQNLICFFKGWLPSQYQDLSIRHFT